MKDSEATGTTQTATVAEQGAHVAPEKAPSKKGATQKKGTPKGQNTAQGANAKAATIDGAGYLNMPLMDKLPIIAHEASGLDCCGCIIVTVRGNDAELSCNECGAVLGVVDARILEAIVSFVP